MSDSFSSQLTATLSGMMPRKVFAAAGSVGDKSIAPHQCDIQRAAGWAEARHAEHVAGRWCARQALVLAGVQAESELNADADGVPQWPSGIRGSITHSRGLCAAVVSRSAEYQLLGLDLERTNRMRAAAMERVVHPLECDFAAGEQLNSTILFSLKEAFYKAQYAQWRTPGNFHDLALEVNPEQGSARVVEISSRFAPALVEAAQELQFSYALFEGHVVSLCCLKA